MPALKPIVHDKVLSARLFSL